MNNYNLCFIFRWGRYWSVECFGGEFFGYSFRPGHALAHQDVVVGSAGRGGNFRVHQLCWHRLRGRLTPCRRRMSVACPPNREIQAQEKHRYRPLYLVSYLYYVCYSCRDGHHLGHTRIQVSMKYLCLKHFGMKYFTGNVCDDCVLLRMIIICLLYSW